MGTGRGCARSCLSYGPGERYLFDTFTNEGKGGNSVCNDGAVFYLEGHRLELGRRIWLSRALCSRYNTT